MINKGNIAAAVALALASASASAATTPTDANTLRLGGASATDRSLFEIMVDLTAGVCDDVGFDTTTGAITDTTLAADIYTTASSWDSATPGPGNFTIYCKSRSLAGTPVIGVAKFSGGSETGIEPVKNGTISYTVGGTTAFVTYADPTVLVSGTACNSTTPTVVNRSTVSGADRVGYRVFLNCGKTSTAAAPVPHPLAPAAGQSDVNPELFGYASTGAGLTVDPAVSQAFGIALSRNFYTALQAGLTKADGVTPCTNTAATQEASCVPSLSLAQVRALLSGQFPDVTQITVNGSALAAPVGGIAPRICSRSQTSGTRASVEIAYFGQRCSVTTPIYTLAQETTATETTGANCNAVGCAWAPARLAAADTSNGASPTVQVFSGSGSGEVEKCLDEAAGATDVYALGIMSIDRIPNDTSKEFRFIKVDGVLPTAESMVAAKWNYYTEAVLVKPLTTGTGASPNTNLSGVRNTIYNALRTKLRDATFLPKTHFFQAYGRAGVVARPFSAIPQATDSASGRAMSGSIRSAIATLSPVDNCNAIGLPASYPIK